MRRVLRAVTNVAIVIALSAIVLSDAFPSTLTQKAQAAFGGHAGGAVVMRVSDGKVIAVVNPSVSCTQLHSPGSIFKLVTAFAALEEHVSTETAVCKCGGQLKIEGRVLHCTIPNGHGSLRLPEAIAQSCNITFYGLGLKLGARRMVDYARAFGLDKACKGYAGKQAVGTLPGVPLHPVDTARIAVGQGKGFGITLLGAGEMVRRIVKDDVSVAGKDRTIVKRDLAVIRKSMRLAAVKGTCKNAAPDGIAIAGKTGSPEAAGDDDKRSAWFVGYAPYDKPEVVVVVFAERGHGYDTAAPIAKKIFAAYFGGAR